RRHCCRATHSCSFRIPRIRSARRPWARHCQGRKRLRAPPCGNVSCFATLQRRGWHRIRRALMRESLALALQLLGDPAALDTLAGAVALASSESERLRLARTEAWIRLRFALPGDHRALRLIRTLS